MSHHRRILKKIDKIYRQIIKKNVFAIKKQIIWLLRALLVTKRRRASANAGFVLPTVAMVALVVVLLTTAILFRSFERAKNASNVRVNEAVLNAASPALERAKAKIEQLFRDPRLSSTTPSDDLLSQVINKNLNQFTFGNEIQLKLVKEFNGKTNIQEDEETLKSAWKYPVDTDNNSKFDSYTLYGIYFRTSTTSRARTVLEARTPPMDESSFSTQCQSLFTTSGNLVSTQGWYKVGDKLKKSIFVFTTTVPITDLTGLDTSKYEKFTGNNGFLALEYQQDRERIPLNNNFVVFEDDLEIAPEQGINLNGRVFTNGNLLTKAGTNPIRYYLVSSPNSCYSKEENSKIIVAGNVIDSRVTENSSGNDVQVDLFNQSSNSTIISEPINNINKTVPSSVYGNTAAYNDEAYAQRIDRLVQATNIADLPDEVTQQVKRDLDADPTLNPDNVRNEKLRIYFRKRTRRVPYAEVPPNGDSLATYNSQANSPLQGSGNSLRPVDAWIFPYDPANGTNATNYAKIDIKENGSNKTFLAATAPEEQAKEGRELKIGDRILVGNNLPQLWFDATKDRFVSSPEGQTIVGKQWDIDKNGNNSTVTRERFSQAFQLEDLEANRDGFWEKSAAQKPQSPLDIVGGLRVVTGAGIYLSSRYTPSGGTSQFAAAITDPETVWADSMPIGVTNNSQGLPDDNTPYLRMRATVVYHYQDDSYNPKTPTDYQTPIACVSSYYDPTSSKTAINREGLPDIRQRVTVPTSIPNRSLELTATVSAADAGNSNNGVVYSVLSLSTTGYEEALKYQTTLKYPNERWVNEPLNKAWDKITASKPLTLSDQSAVDSAMCALKIWNQDNSIRIDDSAIPHGTIMETAFLDARQIEAIDKPISTPGNSDLDVESRQPLEIRATVLDLDLLRRKPKTNGEFLFPNSGIIYATRDDALEDKSNAESRDVSATDFKLDPTRRPNAIMLINGSNLSRNATYKPEEKGLILASNLPVYIKGNFNIHTQEEFTDNSLKQEKDWSNKFYARQSLNSNFACRQGQFSDCNTGETWRSAVVIADAITVLSNDFQFDFRDEKNDNKIATNTETNVVFAQGNIPGRPNETNGGLENFVRYLERWEGKSHTVAGSFIQFKHSNYATAPWQTPTDNDTNASKPNRFWSYDVALLSQPPDLFTQRFTTPSTKHPSEFYREVGRDDAWVKTLLCAAQDGNVGGYENAPTTYGSNFKYAVSQDQRGTCP
ncbi:hormogonium polysaccharide biosynthesis protein HpsA [Scytonema sp. PCC 10023]|uniref:hormogonium polysaccharide biosynthesis protein HpsA n=1 Tax=Scytonema sp. PCC 10023 TaxID=1680591 RepID=UPI0039C6E2BA